MLHHHQKGDNGDTHQIWKTAPVLTGTTQFEPRSDVRNIMVTGGAGFIASWVVRHLATTYPDAYNIICFDKMDYCSSPNNTAVLADRPNFTTYSHVDLSFGNSYSFTQTNVFGTHVLLESAKKVGIRRFIHVSTDEVYGEVKEDKDDLPEASILAPTNPYSASKAAAEMMVQSYQASFKLPCIIVRSNNVYGPHQYPEKIIPKFACLLNRRQPVVLHGDGSPTRRYLYAGDAADAFDTILHKGQVGQIYNVGSSDEVSNLDLCAKLLSVMGMADGTDQATIMKQAAFRRWVKYTHDRPFNDCRYAVDGSKLRRLGWDQKTNLDAGLRVTIDWYRRFGEAWWGDISHVLTPFPVVEGGSILPDFGHRLRDDPVGSDDESQLQKSRGEEQAKRTNGVAATKMELET
ncbi:hypothetical protein LMH87_011733 [Akanthomyces muscarius]|uniref:NAD(P)-binding domain-containing protein n=1 Tax=Akanthomyces muscarius TaxID=2231603 RepID=A0A9W8UK83_AKAMU|nr:hypothetical protein LMH87_011733 [Akanthomyces muscarius]KAJ4151012.1 hypothetical protein LMH87_011733 [Akanthomyces muscarius]